MKLTLKDFQEDAAQKLVDRLRLAQALRKNGDQAVILSSPTGSGKTVIATAAIETLLFGDDITPADEGAVFLWITDQPELNEQTRRKMLMVSSRLRFEHLLTIESTFDDQRLAAGHVYFINTQKLSAAGLLTRSAGDTRARSFWDTMNSTIQDDATRLYVAIDEAHRGMTESVTERQRATSILQRFVKGTAEMRPAPVILGITATPRRFEALLEGTDRTRHPVTIDVAEVRASGLIKDKTVAIHPTDGQAADMTLLRDAARMWLTYVEAWRAYCRNEGEGVVVRPLLIVQVEDGTKGSLSRTDIAAVVHAIREEVGEAVDLSGDAIAHAFQEGIELPVGAARLRYVRPADIDDDADVAVVLFKSSLNVGWDCPRAEVMMSFRRAEDFTNIAQLVGRMVRNPLARRIERDERLNRVWLYLPHYNVASLARVIEHLKESGEAAAGSDVESGAPIQLRRRADTAHLFARIEGLPTYTVPRIRRVTDLRRLARLARALSADRLDPEAEERERSEIVSVLLAERERLAKDASFQAVVEERGALELRRAEWSYGTTEVDQSTLVVRVADENLDDVFGVAGRRLGEGLHRDYWSTRVKNDLQLERQAKLEVVALATRDDVYGKLNRHAIVRIRDLFDTHDLQIETLSERRRLAYQRIKELSSKPEVRTLRLPDTIDVRAVEERHPAHIYVDEQDEDAPLRLGGWETRTLAEERTKSDFLGWLRNIDRRDWALHVPYERDGNWRPFFPDFFILRRSGESVVVDLLDPHNPELTDAVAKAKGLADYARRHGSRFGRVELIAEVKGVLRRLDLKDEGTRDRIFRADTPRALQLVFETDSVVR